jgi:hypothetical protein
MIMTDHVLVDIILKKDCSIIGDGYHNLLFIFCLLFIYFIHEIGICCLIFNLAHYFLKNFNMLNV